MGRALVMGLGLSGLAAAEFLLWQGEEVIGVEANQNLLETLNKKPKGFICLHESEVEDLSGFDQVILSPGIPLTHPLCQLAKQKRIPLIGEAELGLRHCKQPCLAITGTNGKTTVTLLTAHVLNQCGIKAKALGNVGEPLSSYFIHPDPQEVIVAEISSYQLETMQTEVFDAGVLLNITPDHLDRHGNMEEYAKAKLRLLSCMKPGAPFYLHAQILQEYAPLVQGFSMRTFGHHEDSFLWTDRSMAKMGEKVEYILPLSYREWGMHESENVLAVWALVKEFGIGEDLFIKSIETFKKPPHRIEFVTMKEGVAYYNDSKGTNIDAVIQAVKAMKGSVILIAGGVDKGFSYAGWKKPFENKVKQIIAIGAAAQKIYRELSDRFSVILASSLQEAVNLASGFATAGDCVLLSPGCASYDMFRDYVERGEMFKYYIDHLGEKK